MLVLTEEQRHELMDVRRCVTRSLPSDREEWKRMFKPERESNRMGLHSPRDVDDAASK